MARGGGGGKGNPGWEAIVERICESLSTATVEGCTEQALDRCANNGQLALITDIMDGWLGQQDSISNGDFDPVETTHPEAVGQIVEHANYRCQRAAEECAKLRATV